MAPHRQLPLSHFSVHTHSCNLRCAQLFFKAAPIFNFRTWCLSTLKRTCRKCCIVQFKFLKPEYYWKSLQIIFTENHRNCNCAFKSCQNCIQTIRPSSIHFLAVVKKIHDISLDTEKETMTRNLPIPFERHWSIAAQWNRTLQSVAHCNVGFLSRQALRKNISPSHRSQLMQHGWKTVISHDAFSFLTDLCGRVSLQGREMLCTAGEEFSWRHMHWKMSGSC